MTTITFNQWTLPFPILLQAKNQQVRLFNQSPKTNQQMAKNILGITPFYDQFYALVLDNLRRTLTGNEQIDNIEIQIKYAQFKSFSFDIDQRTLKDIPNSSVRERILQIHHYQREQFFKSLQTLSKQSIINLNPLGRNTYQLISGFDQDKYKKFYHIRDFLIKICQLNHTNNYQARPVRGQSGLISIYQQLSLNANSHLLAMKYDNQIRMDMYIKELAPEGLRGRYSYSSKQGWKKTEKAPICPQLDFMLNQRTFRFAINRQIQTEVDPLTIAQIAEFLQKNPKVLDIRLKKLMRVNKGDICEYALSQIYNINEKNNSCCPLILSKITCLPYQLNAYLSKIFINFYTVNQKSNIKFQIQSEFSKEMTKRFKNLIMKDRLPQVKHQIQSAIEQLYSFYFCDHITKVKQVPWLNRKCSQMPETRLQNQYGNYMRQELYELMKKQR